MTAQYYVQTLKLQPHPEGGYFAENYRSAETIEQTALPQRFGGARVFGTAIYFLLESHHVSALHRIHSDEVWHFYAGDPLEIFVIDPAGSLTVIRLGADMARGEVFQAVVSAGCWFGSKPAESTVAEFTVVQSTRGESTPGKSTPAGFCLVGCTVAPGFDFADFEMADRTALLAEYPEHRAVIERLTH